MIDSEDTCAGFDDALDVDKDGIPDGCDDDSDNDGVVDSEDTCPGFDDALDADNDGIPDGCDDDVVDDDNDDNDDNDDTIDAECIHVYNIISPDDGNDKNGFLKIDCIEKYPNNTLTVCGRWGAVVFRAKNYDNIENVFVGKNNRGKSLPVGTYFFILERGKKAPIKGWIYINR